MAKLTKDEFLDRLKNRDSYLYQASSLTATNDDYLKWAYDYITKNELEMVNGEWKLKNISQITRKESYYINRPLKKEGEKTNRKEEWLVIDLYENNLNMTQAAKNKFGKITNYQVPLKNKKSDKGAGKLDFVGLVNDEFYIAEIKITNSNESILKAILEIQTYYQIVNKEKLLSDFKYPKNTRIKKKVVIASGTKASKQFLENELIKDLTKKLNIEVDIYNLEDNTFDVI